MGVAARVRACVRAFMCIYIYAREACEIKNGNRKTLLGKSICHAATDEDQDIRRGLRHGVGPLVAGGASREGSWQLASP